MLIIHKKILICSTILALVGLVIVERFYLHREHFSSAPAPMVVIPAQPTVQEVQPEPLLVAQVPQVPEQKKPAAKKKKEESSTHDHLIEQGLQALSIPLQADVVRQCSTLSQDQQIALLNYYLHCFINPYDKHAIDQLVTAANRLSLARDYYPEFYEIINHYQSDALELMLALRECPNKCLPEVVLNFQKDLKKKISINIFKSIRQMAKECLDAHYAYLHSKMVPSA